MSAPVNRRQWLISTGLAAGSSVLLPKELPALGTAQKLDVVGTYHDRLLEMEARTGSNGDIATDALLSRTQKSLPPVASRKSL